jgi:DNA-binding CsgD family transcriptional regulator
VRHRLRGCGAGVILAGGAAARRLPGAHADACDLAGGRGLTRRLRRNHPRLGVLVLSQYLESHYATSLLTDTPEHAGYLLSEECVVDLTIVARLMRPRATSGPLDRLSQREREVLALMAGGRSNSAISAMLGMGGRTLEAHVRQIFQKLDLPRSADDHRRVLAVVRYLQAPSR